MTNRATVLVAGMGSELQSDDAFGLAVVRRIVDHGAPEGVEVLEAGTAGIGLVQQLYDNYDALIIVDAADRDGEPGTLYLLEPEIPRMSEYGAEDQRALLSDMHYTVPSRVLTLAEALDILPPTVYIVGCQPGDLELGLELSPAVAAAVDDAVSMVLDLSEQLIEAQPSSPDPISQCWEMGDRFSPLPSSGEGPGVRAGRDEDK